ncbi:MAG: gluconokinase [Burkholderiales bacterium]|nr:MAG: gluconokinase [Burkholderiales bacterium]
MGVSGSGKTTLANNLAIVLNGKAYDADDFHDPASVAKMRAGVPLTDADRAPWLRALNRLLHSYAATDTRGDAIDALACASPNGTDDTDDTDGSGAPAGPVVLACSALKASYREEIFRGIEATRLIFLDGDYETIAARIRERSATTSHYMPEALLRSQFDALERPSAAICIDVTLPPEAQLKCALYALNLAG